MTKNVPADPIMLAGMTDCLAIAIENAVDEWGDTLDGFLEKFIASELADSFSNQAPFVTTGRTGEELVAKVNERISGSPQNVRIGSRALTYSKYYWIGYAIALFVAETGYSVERVVSAIPAMEWLRMYPIFHEYGDELLLVKLSEVVQTNVSNFGGGVERQ